MSGQKENPLLDLRSIPPGEIPDIVKEVKNRHGEIDFPYSVGDIEGRTIVSQIMVDVFKGGKKRAEITSLLTEEEEEFLELTDALELAFSTVDSKKTEESIRNTRERWEDCLKKANGDLEKARELFDLL